MSSNITQPGRTRRRMLRQRGSTDGKARRVVLEAYNDRREAAGARQSSGSICARHIFEWAHEQPELRPHRTAPR